MDIDRHEGRCGLREAALGLVLGALLAGCAAGVAGQPACELEADPCESTSDCCRPLVCHPFEKVCVPTGSTQSDSATGNLSPYGEDEDLPPTMSDPGTGDPSSALCIEALDLCDQPTDCCAGLDCLPDASGTLICKPVGSGSACPMLGDPCNAPDACCDGSMCSATTRRCEAPPSGGACGQLNQSCASNSCCSGLTCDPNFRVCTNGTGTNSSTPPAPQCIDINLGCGGGGVCCPGLNCTGGICQLGGSSTPQQPPPGSCGGTFAPCGSNPFACCSGICLFGFCL